MAKGYWISRVDVTDPKIYKSYVEAAAPAFEKYGARFLVRGGRRDALEGTSRARNVLIEFDSLEQARACYHSPEYAKARAFREKSALADLVLVEGI